MTRSANGDCRFYTLTLDEDLAFARASHVLDMCHNVLGLSRTYTRVSFRGKLVGNNQSLSECGIRSGDKVDLVVN